MKIIKQGYLPESHITQAKCSNCNTITEVEQRECVNRSSQRDGPVWSFQCPFPGCNRTVFIYKWDS